MDDRCMTRSICKNTVELVVFGCQMNKLDAELIRSLLEEEGFVLTKGKEEAGVILFLTCSVREHAEARVHSRVGSLKALKKKSPDVIIGILGCMAQKDGEKLIERHPHVDVVVGTRDFPRIAEILKNAGAGERGIVARACKERPRVRRKETRRPFGFKAFLSIMRGCNSYCSYCVVPFVRGREESRPLDKIVEEAGRLVDDGVKEITLLGQTVNGYKDGAGNRLPELLYRLDALPGLARLSFVTSYPGLVEKNLAEAMSSCSTVSRFIHLPAQSGSDRVLEMMKCRYTSAFYLETAAMLKESMPDIELASDFIVGFPGETRSDFEATMELMREVRFQQCFVFKYSPRPGTLAAQRYGDDVPQAVKEERNAELLTLQKSISREKNNLWEGRFAEVLVEGVSPRNPDRYTGRTVYNQIVAFPASDELVGRIVKVKVERTTPLTLIGGEVVEVMS